MNFITYMRGLFFLHYAIDPVEIGIKRDGPGKNFSQRYRTLLSDYKKQLEIYSEEAESHRQHFENERYNLIYDEQVRVTAEFLNKEDVSTVLGLEEKIDDCDFYVLYQPGCPGRYPEHVAVEINNKKLITQIGKREILITSGREYYGLEEEQINIVIGKKNSV